MTPIKAWLGYPYPFGPGEGEIPRDPSQVGDYMRRRRRGRADDVGITGMVGQGSAKISPIMSSAIVHHQIEKIHPFAEGNGRAGRMLSVWELFRRGSTTITFS
jgi:hypothetical protein